MHACIHPCIYIRRERDRQTGRDREKQRQTYTERETKRERETDRQRQTETEPGARRLINLHTDHLPLSPVR